MVPMTTGANIPSSEPAPSWPSPANLPTACVSAFWSRPPNSDESNCDPWSMKEDCPPLAKHVCKGIKRTRLLLRHVRQSLRPTGLCSHLAERGQDCGYCRDDGLFGGGAVKAERRCDAPDHLGCQELCHERDKIYGHAPSPLYH